MSIERINRLDTNLDRLLSLAVMGKIIEVAVAKQYDYMIELNEKQLDEGLKADGTPLPPYSPVTVAKKKKVGQQHDKMNLKWTGEYRKGLKVKKFGNKLEIQSSDSKDEELQERYGEEILGVSDQNRILVSHAMKADLLTGIKKLLY